MNSRERFLAAINGKEPDRPPLAHVAALTTFELQDITKCYMPSVHFNPEELARLCFANHEILGFDAVSFIINYFNEPAALGCRMKWGGPKELPVYDSHLWTNEEDAVIPENFLDRQPVKTCLESISKARKDYGGRVAVLGKIMGPLSMVQVMRGVQDTMLDMMDNPEKINLYLEVAAGILIKFANAQFQAGADAISIGEGGAGSNMISPAMHRRFLLGVHKKMIREIEVPAIMHICGDISSRLDILAETGFACFNFDRALSPETMKSIAGEKFRLMGNVGTSELLRAGPREIESQVIENLESGVEIISPGCACSPCCPNSNFKAMAEAIKKWSSCRS